MRLTLLTLCLVMVLALTAYAVAEMAVDIQVAPATIVLKAPCQWVTVHADIAYGTVDPESVEINGLEADRVFADDCGNLVAKVDFTSAIEGMTPPAAQIILTGVTKDGEAFSGSSFVRVK
ncbi:MAG: hypothetical protein ACOX9R_01460 [Armatimonadota bacterium]|jgi:hypothetical protein